MRPASGGVVVTPGATAHGSTASTPAPGATGGIGDSGGGGKSQNGDVDYKKVRYYAEIRERERYFFTCPIRFNDDAVTP